MKKIFVLAASAAALFSLASCNNEKALDVDNNAQKEMSFQNGMNHSTRGYVDGTTFYEKATADMHKKGVDSTARSMWLSAYLEAQEGSDRNYFVNEKFSSNGLTGDDEAWVHTPAYYWPLGGKLSFLGISSTEGFTDKQAVWNDANASSSVVLKFDKSRTQDDVLYGCADASSSDASDVTTPGSYVTGKSVAMSFEHAQAWLEFQLSIAQADMADKIAIKEIIIEDGTLDGKLTLLRGGSFGSPTLAATWTDNTGQSDITFDDTYSVYGHLKTIDEYTTEKADVTAKQTALDAAKLAGDPDAIAVAQKELETAEAALKAAYEEYNLVNALNVVGVRNTVGATANPQADTVSTCAYMDMLVPQQTKQDFIIRYYLAGRPDLLEYRFSPNKIASANWESGNKYIYDIDFVISEITIKPTVSEFIASFDGASEPVEIL